jgi:flagellar basal body-associated protein FliL
LAALLVIGTIFGITRSPDAEPVFSFGVTTDTLRPVVPTDDIRVFSGLGRLRIPLSGSSTLVLSIAFPYNHSDTAFTEELAGKLNDFREIAFDFFKTLPGDKIIQIDEESAKNEILKQYNTILRLGQIEALYFSDMMVLD